MVKSPFALEAGAWTQKPHTSKYLEVTVELNSWITGHACRRSIWQRYFRRWLHFWLKYKAIFIFSFPVYGSHATPCFNNEFKLILYSAFWVDFGSNLFVSQYQCQFSRQSILKRLFCRAKWSPLLSWLQYKNVRPDYLNNIWKVINWKYAGEVYENVLAWIVLMDNTHLCWVSSVWPCEIKMDLSSRWTLCTFRWDRLMHNGLPILFVLLACYSVLCS